MTDMKHELMQYDGVSIEAVVVNDTEWLQINKRRDEVLIALWSTQKCLGETLASLEGVVGAPVSGETAGVIYDEQQTTTEGGVWRTFPVSDVVNEKPASMENVRLARLPVEHGELTWKRPFRRFTTALYETSEIAFSDVRSIGRTGLEAALRGTAPTHLSESLQEAMERLRVLDDLRD